LKYKGFSLFAPSAGKGEIANKTRQNPRNRCINHRTNHRSLSGLFACCSPVPDGGVQARPHDYDKSEFTREL
jgi:hypothetical protein